MKLTIGMSCYDDYDGVWFTIQSILMYHSECVDDINFVVIDGNPESSHGKACEQLISKLKNKHGNNGLYVKNVSWPGTASREYVFNYAKTPYVLCLDSHVQVAPGAIKKLIEFYDQNPECKDLVQGPLLDDSGKLFATEMQPVWDYNMYGKWLNNSARLDSDQPYEVEMMGLGLFSCVKSSWLGFNKQFRGFGGEEGYIHRKFKNAGAKTIVLPWLKWNHRFERPRGVPYQNEYIDRIKNYLIGWAELGLDPQEIIQYYSEENTTPGQERLAISATDLQQLNTQLNNVPEPQPQSKTQSDMKSVDEEQMSALKSRIIELEMKLMEHQFMPKDPSAVKTVELPEYMSQFENNTTPIRETTPSPIEHVDVLVKAPEKTEPEKIENIEMSFQQRLFQQPVEEVVHAPATPPPVPVN